MNSDSLAFGAVDRFQVRVTWIDDDLPVAQRPEGYGWSMGRLNLSVAGRDLTTAWLGNDRQSGVVWYLSPFLHWLADNWVPLLHEERFGWASKDAAPAAEVCRRAIRQFAGAEDEKGQETYAMVQAWHQRHGLRSATAGGLFPDLYIRRLGDAVELSWSAVPPPFAPRGFQFEGEAGFACLPVADVAGPLWDLLRWAATRPPAGLGGRDRMDWEALSVEIDAIERLGPRDFEAAALTEGLLERVTEAFAEADRPDLVSDRSADGPYVEVFSPAVAMFGGLTPDLSDADIISLRDALIGAAGGQDSERLAGLVTSRGGRAVAGVPHEDGYDIAEEFLGDFDEQRRAAEEPDFIESDNHVNVEAICARLGIAVETLDLDTDTIRGVALAGDGFASRIYVNVASPFNRVAEGRRFTIGHELCHILFDRGRARRVAQISGPWVSVGIERRANAFAAYLLMPPPLLRRHLAGFSELGKVAIQKIARKLRVSPMALVEHLYNLDFIDETERESLRQAFRKN